MGKKKIEYHFKDTFQTVLSSNRVEKEKISLQDFVELHNTFMDDKALERLAERTLEEHKTNLNYFLKYVKEDVQSDSNCVVVDGQLFKGYLYYMIYEKEYSSFTVNIRMRTIKCYLKWLYENKHIEENINMKFKLVKTPLDTVKPLMDREVKRLLQACDISTYGGFRDYCGIITILDCGIRSKELVQLKIKDIDLNQGLLNVRAEVSKTRVSRQLPLSIKTCKLLKELIECAIENNSDYLFQSTYGGKIKEQNLMLSFRKLGEKIKLGKRCTPYTLRHTFATNAVKVGIMDLFTLQRIMGHSSLVTTRRYVQLETEDLKRNHKKASPLDNYFK
jgi:integrase/recombinase XerD